MTKTVMRIDGLRELDASLGALGAEFGKPAAKAVLRRIGIKALEPMAELARSLAPDDPDTANDLKASIVVGKPLNKRQRALAKKDQNKALVTVYMGTNDPAGVQQEFGNVNHGPQSFMRPAFDAEAKPTIERIKPLLGAEIEKTAARLTKRRAAKAARAA